MHFIILTFFFMLSFTGCTGPLAVIGQIYGGADTLTSLTTGKGAADAAVSAGSNKDCSIHRIFKNKPMCKEIIQKTEEIKKIDDKSNTEEVKKNNNFLETIANLFNSIKIK